jgi:hypothetical protein
MFESFNYFMQLNAIAYLSFNATYWIYNGDYANMNIIVATVSVFGYIIAHGMYYSYISSNNTD